MPDSLPQSFATTTTVATPPPPKRRALLIAVPLVLLLAALGGAWWWSRIGLVGTDNAYVAGDIAPLSARIEGDVAAILVADNALVREGEPILRLVDTEWLARRDVSAAQLAEARANAAALAAQETQARANVDAVAATVPQAQAALVLARAEAARFGSLAGSGVGSRERAEQTVATQHQAEAALAAAQANQAASQAALPVLAAQRQGAEARILQAQANLALAENDLAYTTIRAPFDGRLSNRAAQLGQHVKPGQALVSVTPPAERQWVVANFKETQLGAIRPGQPVTVVLDVGGPELHGHVDSLAGATGALFSLLPPENATGNFTRVVQRLPVRIRLDAPPAELRPGLSATVTVDTNPPAAR